MPYTIGINFRATDGYVTDGADQTYCLADVYPVTRGGYTFGWVTSGPGSLANRSTGVDVRLAGTNARENTGAQATFRIDLPNADAVDLRLAIGDASYAQNRTYLRAEDGDGGELFTISDATGQASGSFLDANATEFTAANWPGSNVSRSVTPSAVPATKNLQFIIGWLVNDGSEATSLAHIGLVQAVSGPTIDTQPIAQTAVLAGPVADTSVDFVVAATTSGGALVYDWELETSVAGGVYANLANGSGATWSGQTAATATGTFTATTLTGRRVRCNVTDNNGTTVSTAVTLTILAGEVLTQPVGTTNASGVPSTSGGSMTSDDSRAATSITRITATSEGVTLGTVVLLKTAP